MTRSEITLDFAVLSQFIHPVIRSRYDHYGLEGIGKATGFFRFIKAKGDYDRVWRSCRSCAFFNVRSNLGRIACGQGTRCNNGISMRLPCKKSMERMRDDGLRWWEIKMLILQMNWRRRERGPGRQSWKACMIRYKWEIDRMKVNRACVVGNYHSVNSQPRLG